MLLRLLLLLCLSWIFSPRCLLAQNSANPFEIQTRVPEAPVDTISTSTNPFDIQRDGNIPGSLQLSTEMVRDSFNKDALGSTRLYWWLTGSLLLLLAGLLSANRKEYRQIFQSLGGNSAFKVYQHDRQKGISGFRIMAYLFFVLNLTFYAFHLMQFFGSSIAPNIGIFFKLMVIIMVWLISKRLLIDLLGWTFNVQKMTSNYNDLINTYNTAFGLILFILNILLTFISWPHTQVTTYFLVSILLIYWLYRLIVAAFNLNRIASAHQFYFFLYLCAAEILPIWMIITVIQVGGLSAL